MKAVIVLFLLALICIVFYLTRLCQEVADNELTFADRYWLSYNLKCANIFAGVAIAITLLFIFCS